mmetsp:Transcript_4693/g.13481  ORF Transcript_4693/g.13481 Transcript_4693/m.13481 type:complete len:310 (-) Transcript_4693:1730-2659(-)|eukprot:CAMPEP_0206136090 /NCGR_PEP_ID=MMETSP1473-20131121/1319_1 /ASSEMBLY_ACC=CAM_ASM_001109 /TAXON_ID=1461547 /ORGANISM="Stichococcus sp, Strain RCC1054" /LENGTH=309 /DNA_ID=CAMNT_0053528349 /DNA_START=112 /DNA_END=1041 /DNA_ORIENTATION=-
MAGEEGSQAPTPASAPPAAYQNVQQVPSPSPGDIAAYLARLTAAQAQSVPGVYTNQLFGNGGQFQQMQQGAAAAPTSGGADTQPHQLPHHQMLLEALVQQHGQLSDADGAAALAAIAAQTLNGQNDDAWRQQHAQQQVQQAQQQQQQQQVQQAQQQQQQTPQQTPPSMHTAISGLKKDRDDNASGSPASGLDEADITDERELKRIRRKQSNRESARRSRQKKQAECEDLQAKVQRLDQENTALRQENLQLRAKLDVLISQMHSQGGKPDEKHQLPVQQQLLQQHQQQQPQQTPPPQQQQQQPPPQQPQQ